MRSLEFPMKNDERTSLYPDRVLRKRWRFIVHAITNKSYNMNSRSLELLLEVVLVPDTVNGSSVSAPEHALALDHVLPETALEDFSVRKFEQPVAILEIFTKIA